MPRTQILALVAAGLFAILAHRIFHTIRTGSGTQLDPIRAVEAVTADIDFLGPGAIFCFDRTVQGLTTVAGKWLAGAVGVACAIGFYTLAAGPRLLAVIVLAALRVVSHRFIRRTMDDVELPSHS